jgi:hypothetical protein
MPMNFGLDEPIMSSILSGGRDRQTIEEQPVAAQRNC